MKKFTLTIDATNELRRAHRSATNKKDADKIKVVYLLSRGKSAREIAEVLMLDVDTVVNYRHFYESGGVENLLKNNYSGSEPMLSCAELQELSAHSKKRENFYRVNPILCAKANLCIKFEKLVLKYE